MMILILFEGFDLVLLKLEEPWDSYELLKSKTISQKCHSLFMLYQYSHNETLILCQNQNRDIKQTNKNKNSFSEDWLLFTGQYRLLIY